MVVNLTDVCDIQYGYAFDSGLFSDTDGIPLVRIRDVVRGYSETRTTESFPDEYIVNDGDILIGMDGEFNIAKWHGGKAALNQRVCRLVPRKINIDYVFHFMPVALKSIEEKTSFVTVKHLSAKELNKIQIQVPTDEEQHKIASVLNSLSKIIIHRRTQLDEFDTLIKARFVEMFGDIIQNTMRWPQCVFSEIASSRLGKMLDAKQQTGNCRFPYLANFNVQWFRFELGNLNEMDFDEDDRIEFELKDGDLIVCEGGEIGRCAVWHNQIQPCYFQKALHRVRCNTDIILPDYLARWLQYNCEHGGFASIEGAKATIAHLPGAKLKALTVTVPPIDLQEQFVAFVSQVDKSKAVVQAALDKAQLLFDSLMQQYFG